MDCAEFENLLFDSLEGERAPSDVDRMQAHLLTCANCRHLDSLVRGEDQHSAAELPHDFAAGVVARTSGRPCERAQLLLAASGGAAPDEQWLVEQHLPSCPECSAVARSLARLQLDLPMLAEADPGQGFVQSVIAVTSGIRGEPKASQRAGLQQFIERLVQRPRIALEGAFTVAMAVSIVFGSTSLSLTDQPLRAGVETWRSVSNATRTVTASVTEMKAGAIARADRIARSASADAIEMGSTVSDSARELARNAWDDLITRNVQEIRSIWNEKVSRSVESDTSN